MNATMEKFGYPATLLKDYAHWVVLLRPAQVTLGSLVLVAKSEATAFHDLPEVAFTEMHQVSAGIAAALGKAVAHEKLNYLMLMMVDPNVHFHVLPRYSGARSGGGLTLEDESWPGAPNLGAARKLASAELETLRDWLKPFFAS